MTNKPTRLEIAQANSYIMRPGWTSHSEMVAQAMADSRVNAISRIIDALDCQVTEGGCVCHKALADKLRGIRERWSC